MSNLWVAYEGTRFPVRLGEMILGRSAYCTIVVSDVSVSREHASLRLVGEVLLLTDLGSRNGTKVNGVEVRETASVHPGDTIVLGSAALRIESTDEDARSRRPTGNLLDGADDPTTQTTTTMVEIMHRLVDHALESGANDKQLEMIRAVVDSMAESAAKGFKLGESDRPKLARAVAFVVACSGDPSMEIWRAAVLEKLGVEA